MPDAPRAISAPFYGAFMCQCIKPSHLTAGPELAKRQALIELWGRAPHPIREENGEEYADNCDMFLGPDPIRTFSCEGHELPVKRRSAPVHKRSSHATQALKDWAKGATLSNQ